MGDNSDTPQEEEEPDKEMEMTFEPDDLPNAEEYREALAENRDKDSDDE